jgi:hypothetical protein
MTAVLSETTRVIRSITAVLSETTRVINQLAQGTCPNFCV